MGGTTVTDAAADAPAPHPRAAGRTARQEARRRAAWREAVFAYERTAAYRELLDGAGLHPPDLDESAFETLPLLDKAFYRSNFPSGVVASEAALSDERHVLTSTSSGTAGDRLTSVAHTYDLARRMAATTSAHPSFKQALLGTSAQRVARYAAPNCSDVECASPTSTVADRTLRDGTLVLTVGHDLLATSDVLISQAITEIEQYRPHWFYTDATHLAFLLRQYHARGLAPPRPRAVALTYTLATGVARRQVRHHLGGEVPLAEVVSMSELGWVAMECERETLHLNTDSFHVELLAPPTRRPADEGEVGEAVVTSLGDRLEPHVRYRTGDLYRLLPPCPCGHRFPAVRHEGRGRHVLQLPDGRTLTPKAVDDLVGPDPGVIAYRVHQRSATRFRVKYIPSPAAPGGTVPDLEERVRHALGPEAEVAVEATPYIASERSGKFFSCVSDLPWTEREVA